MTIRRGRARERGQSLVEFAFVFPVFMFILAAMIQMGVVLWASNTMNQIVRDTGRYAATVCQSPTAAADVSDRFDTLVDESGGPWTNAVLAPVTYVNEDTSLPPSTCPDENDQTAWVTVSASMDAFVFFPIMPGDGHVSSSTTYRVEPNP